MLYLFCGHTNGHAIRSVLRTRDERRFTNDDQKSYAVKLGNRAETLRARR